jgi:hypothetical protein
MLGRPHGVYRAGRGFSRAAARDPTEALVDALLAMHLPHAARERNDDHAARRENETSRWNPPRSSDAVLIQRYDASVQNRVPARLASEMLSELRLKIATERDGFRIARDLQVWHHLLEPDVPTE